MEDSFAEALPAQGPGSKAAAIRESLTAKAASPGTSLVVQWLRLKLSMQGALVQSLNFASGIRTRIADVML